MEITSNAIVIDNGSLTTRAGFSGNELPSFIIPTVVGYPRNHANSKDLGLQDYYVGNSALAKKDILQNHYPIACGIINNFHYAEHLWNYIITKELSTTPQDHPIIMTEKPNNPKGNREKTVQIMFESLSTPLFYLNPQPIFTLFSAYQTTGIILDIGEQMSHCTPVYEGSIIKNAALKTEVSGMHLTEYFRKQLIQRNPNVTTLNDSSVIRKIKEDVCSVADNYKEINETYMILYTLPDGKEISIGKERYTCSESLFQPPLVGLEFGGCHSLIELSITKCNEDIHKELYNNILLSGGSSMISKFDKRIEKEMKLLQPNKKIKIVDQPNRGVSSWIGASIASSLSSFKGMCISTEKYDEYGPYIVHEMC